MIRTLYICESGDEARQASDQFCVDTDIILSLSFEACTELNSRAVPFVEPRDVPTVVNSLERSRAGFERSLDILRHLGQINSEGKEFDSISRGLIDGHLYILKIAIDQATLIIECAKYLIEINRPHRVVLSPERSIQVNSEGLLDQSASVVTALLIGSRLLEGVVVNSFSPSSGEVRPVTGTSFGQVWAWQHNFSKGTFWIRRFVRKVSGLSHVARIATEKVCLVKSVFARLAGAKSILSLNSKEVHGLRSYGKPRVYLLRVKGVRQWREKRLSDIWATPLLFANSGMGSVLNYTDVSMEAVLRPVIDYIERSTLDLRKNLPNLESFIRKVRPSLIVLDSMSPFNRDALPVRIAAQKVGVEVVCWMHGGYGAYESLAGYDVTDLRLARNHIVYGPAVKKLLQDLPQSALELGAEVPKRIIAAGTPYFEKMYLHSLERLDVQKRPRVLFCLGPRYHRNQFYFGYPRIGVETGLWKENIEIAESLTSISNVVEVVIKEYPGSPDAKFWSDFAKKRGLLFVSGEIPFDQVMKSADYVVLTWVSTTFFQALLAKKPLLLWDNSDLTTSSREVLDRYPGFQRDIRDFCEVLRSTALTSSALNLDTSDLRNHFLSDSSSCSRQALLEIFETPST